MRPSNPPKTDVPAVLDEPLSRETVQIQFQSILQANTFAWPWHPDSLKPRNSHSGPIALASGEKNSEHPAMTRAKDAFDEANLRGKYTQQGRARTGVHK
jgi:hypothetical protein